jgi:hypothetical protein
MEKSVTGPQKTKNKNKKTTKKNKLVSTAIWSSHPLLGIRDLSEGNEVNMGGGGSCIQTTQYCSVSPVEK